MHDESTSVRPGADGRRRGRLAALLAVSVALASCARELPPPPPPGSLIYRSGVGEAPGSTSPVPGPLFLRPGILVPDPPTAWQGNWIERDTTRSPLAGAGTGLAVGVSLAQIGPVALLFWPAAVGIVAGAAVLGAAGGGLGPDLDPSRLADPDRQAVAAATATLRPDALLREAVAEAVAERTGRTVMRIPWDVETSGPSTAAGADGLLDLRIELLGLSAIEEADVFGILLRVRIRALDPRDGTLRYERLLTHGPTSPLPGLSRPPVHSFDILAMDGARAYRHQLAEILRQVAQAIAADPALPVAER
jgi:hypothetical protein